MSYKWYDKSREYEYGYYDVNKKKYFNEDSGKWVTRLNKKVIDEKYIRYEFSYWDDREIDKIFGYELVERVSKFISILFKKGIEVERRKGTRWVYVESSKICNGILGSNYIDVINELFNKGIIDVKYGVGKFGKDKKLYKLNENFFGEDCERRVVYIRNTKLNRFLNKLNSGELSVGDARDEFIYWEIESCKKVDVVSNSDGVGIILRKRLDKRIELDWDKRDWDFISNRERNKINQGWSENRRKDYLWNGRLSFELMKVELDEVKRGGVSFNGFSKDTNSGRYINIIINKEKEFRSVIKLDGENVVEVDMVNGYVSLFYRLLKGIKCIKKGDSPFDDYIKNIVGDIEVDDFLNKYEMCFEGDVKGRIDFYKFLGLDLGVIDKNIGEVNRVYMKELILYLINGERGDGLRKRYLNDMFSYDELMEKIFCKGGFRVIEAIKSSDISFKLGGRDYYGYEKFKNMSRVLMSMEVLTMKGIWRKMIDKKIHYISLYDGMLVRKSDLNIVNGIIDNELLGYNSCIRFKSK
uniref:hypothetical protein n=1 Tax=Polaribacter sp. TaxID=1920175 RepID=UPI0040479424